MCHGFCCCATPPSCLPLWKVQKFFCVWISGNSDKLPEGLVICPDWSPPKPKEDAAVAQSSTNFSLCFVSHFFFSICCLHPTVFFIPVCAAPAPHWCPIPVILFLKEPNLLFVSVSFIKKGLKFQSSWTFFFFFNSYVCVLQSQSVNLTRSLALCQHCTKIRSGICMHIVVHSRGREITILTGRITQQSASVIWHAAVRELILSSILS